VVWYFRRWIQTEGGGYPRVCCVITSSEGYFSHTYWCYELIIIAGEIIWIKWPWTKSWTLCREEDIAIKNTFRFNDGNSSIFGTVCILHILQYDLVVLDIVRSLILMSIIRCLVPLPEWSQLPEKLTDICRNLKQIGHWSYFCILFVPLLLRNLYSQVFVFLPLCLFLSQSLHNPAHRMEHVIVGSDDMIQSNCIPSWHPQGLVSDSP
jgi:hypothetical protein